MVGLSPGLATGFTDRLGLTKSSTFVAHVHLHELSQVPLVNAKFRVKFKFKGATTVTHGHEFAAGSADEAGGAGGGASKAPYLQEHGASDEAGGALIGRSGSKARSSTGQRDTSHGRDSLEAGYSSGGSSRPSGDYGERSPPHSPALNPDHLRTPNPNRTPIQSHQATFGNYSFGASSTTASDKDHPIRVGSELAQSKSHHSHSSGGGSGGGEDGRHSIGERRGAATLMPVAKLAAPRIEAKGTTTLVPLRSHAAVFDRELQCPVAINLKSIPGSSKYQLQPSPLKLSVRQEVNGDGGKKEEAKTGEVVLDLAQFVGNGRALKSSESTPRRYLLRNCKTNATMKVTVRMEWIGGENDFIAPPLKSGQFKESSSSLPLSHNGFNKSSSSVNSTRKASGTPSVATNMSRTNSSSSISVNSVANRPSSSAGPGQPRRWRPSGGGFSSSPSPTLLGGSSSASDRTAAEIIETIFNRPSAETSWAHLSPSEPNSLNNSTNQPRFQLQVPISNSPGRPKTVSRSSTRDGLSDDGALIFSVGKSSNKQASSSILGVGPPPSSSKRIPLSRQATSSSTNSKSRSVRWGDDTPASSRPNSNDNSPQRSQVTLPTSTSSLAPTSTPPSALKGPSLSNKSSSTSLSEKLKSSSATGGATKKTNGKPGIEWNNSWA